MSIEIELKNNDQILFDKGQSIVVGRIVEIREKAVKMDYAIESIWNNALTVFNWSVWVPKSVIKEDRGSLTVKKWFANKFEGGHHIKKYFMEGEKQIFI